MKQLTYLWTSETFTGAVVFTFNEDGQLLKYDISEAGLDKTQMEWFTTRLPRNLEELKSVLKSAKKSRLAKLPDAEITFELFWDRYNEKVRSSRKKTLQKWNRLSKSDQKKAFIFIALYERSLDGGIAKKYAETYLNAELWNN